MGVVGGFCKVAFKKEIILFKSDGEKWHLIQRHAKYTSFLINELVLYYSNIETLGRTTVQWTIMVN